MLEKKDQYPEEDSLTKLSMDILIHAGNARENLVKGLDKLEEDDFEVASSLLKIAHKEIVIAHGLQTSTLQLEAEGKQIRYSPLFCHAQDTLMTAQSELLIADHLNRIFSKHSSGGNRE
ncbi:hypothetical protein ACX51_14680 [Lacticaseibacillus paracasei]|uniref:PTS lactose/cellobiose transporter subunit IIA n=1 Tax=Lacticaseibacillus paracasei TaxID=1597 RepID=A0ABD6VWS5_LACPA|nr:PTS lactose/cellobiose transporter subunit IIA [Lacticaseibacillus paracasei]POE39156.1 hypothetical protein ACX51_14680 [Lacticaseibacillus paracasei]